MDYRHEPLSQRSSTDSSRDGLLEKNDEFVPRPRRIWWQRMPLLVVHATLIVIYTAVCIMVVWRATAVEMEHKSHQIDTPARSALQDVEIVWDHHLDKTEKYFGKPSTKVDDAWDEILNYQSFKFSKEEMTRWGRVHEGVALTDGSGYMGTLSVFHELHCLKRLYMYIHKDLYFQNLSAYYENQNLHHMMHCLENMRQGIVCRADSSPITYLWGQERLLPLGNFTSPHECKNWDVFMDWVKEKSFDPYQPGLVVHPIHGPVYINGGEVEKRLGIAVDKPLQTT